MPQDNIQANDPAFLYLNLRPTEEIKLIVRHHWAGFLSTLLIVLGMIIGPVVLLALGNTILKNVLDNYFPLLVLVTSGYVIFLLTFLLGSWINYYYDIIVITNERMINVDQEGLLSRRISELNMVQIQNVTAEVNGILRSLFNFGLLVVETAGEGTTARDVRGVEGYFTIEDIPDPSRVARLIIELHRLAVEEDENNP